MDRHKCKPSCDRLHEEWKHLDGKRYRITRLRYVKGFDDQNQKLVEYNLDRVSRALDTLRALGVEARVSYGEHR